MALVKDFSTFKKYVKYNFSSADIKSLLDTGPAEREFVLPLIGQTLYDDLRTQVANNNITSPDLFDIVCAAIVPLTVYKELPFLQIQLGDTGLKKLLSDNTQGAFRWEYNEIKDTLEDKGCKALDQLLLYLYANKTALSWTPPAQQSIVFKTGSEFSPYFTLKYPERTFRTIEDLVKDAEEQYVGGAIGDAFLKELMTKENPSDDEKEAIRLIKKATANYSIMKVIEKRPIKITPHGLFVMIGDAVDDSNPKDKTPGVPQLQLQRNAVERDGDSYITKLKLLLNKKASPTVFATYYSSDKYQSPAAAALKPNPNSNRKTYGF